MKVCILLAAYNGAAYIRKQIDSILQQDYPNIQLVLSDDGSRDGTQEILAEYEAKYPDKVIWYQSGKRFGKAQTHFMHLLRTFHDAPYIMFSDQDDVWHPDKVSKTLEKMREIETDSTVPALVHTDLRVVDQDLNVKAQSFCEYSNINGYRLKLNQLLVQNVVTGCTVMINRTLAELSCAEISEDAIIMHDWWIALLAAACGTLGFLNEATIDYRQHGNNSVGAKNVRSLSYIWSKFKDNRILASMQMTFGQARSFEKCYSAVLADEIRKVIQAYAELERKNAFIRKWTYLKYGFWKFGLLRKLGQFVRG